MPAGDRPDEVPLVPTSRHAHLVVAESDRDLRLDQWLVRHLSDLSRSQAQRLIREGHVRLSDGVAKPALAVWPGLVVDVEIPRAAPAEVAAESLPLVVVYEDDDIAVVDKPAGMVVHPGAGHGRGTLVNALLHHLRDLSGVGGRERPGIVHRLDRGTSGVLVVAKHDRAHRALAGQFHDRRVGKEYLALVWGALAAGKTMDRPIGRDPRHRQKMSTRARRARAASTTVIETERLGAVSFVRLAIGTGRTHQIRVHLSESGHPIVGDALYGGLRRRLPTKLAAVAQLTRPFLHAARLTFRHPVNDRALSFDVPLPPDLQQVLVSLRHAAGGK